MKIRRITFWIIAMVFFYSCIQCSTILHNGKKKRELERKERLHRLVHEEIRMKPVMPSRIAAVLDSIIDEKYK